MALGRRGDAEARLKRWGLGGLTPQQFGRSRPPRGFPPINLMGKQCLIGLSSVSPCPQIRSVRKGIARVLTVFTAKQREALKEKYAGAKYVPQDLRAKKTRAIRRR